jgi:hypothetical protein
VSPGKRKAPEGTGADATTRPDLPPSIVDEDADSVDDPGFFHKALSGKVRPAPKEPAITHYEHFCGDECRSA